MAILCFWIAAASISSTGDWAFDFRQFWQGGKDVVDGVSPYPSEQLLATAGDHLTPEEIQVVFRFPYPAAAALFLAPFGALPFDVAAVLWGALLIGVLFAAMWILGVRDWRVAGVVIASAPVIAAVRLGTLTPVLILLLAVAWRWRDRWWAAGGALAAALSLKLFLWPMVVWLAATRRFAAAAAAAGLAALATLAAWAAIGFEGMSLYPDLVRKLSAVVADRGYSLVALGVDAGLPDGVAEALPWIVGLALLVAVVVVARDDVGERRAFAVAVVASIALTPIVWQHYFALLVVPLALARPSLSRAWALLMLFWLVPMQESNGALWRIVFASAVVGAVLAVSAAQVKTPSAR